MTNPTHGFMPPQLKTNKQTTFNFDKQDVNDFTKFSKMTMCRASKANS
jgi:hypothetical protein